MIGKLPFIPGHEATGVITEVGKDVKDLSVGTRIAIENHFYCGNCYSCNVRLNVASSFLKTTIYLGKVKVIV